MWLRGGGVGPWSTAGTAAQIIGTTPMWWGTTLAA